MRLNEMWNLLYIIIFVCCIQRISAASINPHIVFILADDLGWNDVGFHGSNQIPTPNIDALAYTGVILNNYYVTPLCTPSRSALLTGKYPIHTGLQHGVIHGSAPYGLSLKETIFPQFLQKVGYITRAVGKWHLGMQHQVIYGCEPWGLSLNDTILPEYLKKSDYVTAAVGKWHLGHFKKEYLPVQRGFDSHYGYWTGHQDYYDHTAIVKNRYWGYDMRRGMNVSWSDYGQYTTDLFTNEAVQIIKNHNTSRPLFLYLAHLAVHSANPYSPLEAPENVVSKFQYIKNKQRRLFAGMLSKLDESVGKVVLALAETNMLENSIIVFSSDNGGPAAGFNLNAASNWPLRGVKDTLWEGGVKGVGLIWSTLLPSSKIHNSLMHITDWLPTLLSATKFSENIPPIDGINMWKSFFNNNISQRSEILLNIDTERNIAALRYKNWKLKKGNARLWNDWYGPSGRDYSYNWSALYKSTAAKAMKHIVQLPKKAFIEKIRKASTVNCNIKTTSNISTSENYLFNLDNDACEQTNLFSSHSNIVEMMEKKLKTYFKTMVPPRNKPADPKSNPKYWGYTWTNWMDFM